MRVATWNLERPRPRGYTKNKAILAQIAETDADLWVLTETSVATAPSGYTAIATPPVPGYHREGENYTTVLSRWPVLRTLSTWQPSLAVCVEIDAPAGPCLVYGTIITYANYRGEHGTSARWIEHRKSIAAHLTDWRRLHSAFPDHDLIVAGDFNQSRDGSGWYEDATAVAALTSALETCNLRCVTQQNFRTVLGLSRSTIDHICLGGRLRDLPALVTAWEGSRDGIRMSDHNGVAVRVDA
jgi:endonuclease/exonuclease/phosphatase (EEP) superfamily protein YafD